MTNMNWSDRKQVLQEQRKGGKLWYYLGNRRESQLKSILLLLQIWDGFGSQHLNQDHVRKNRSYLMYSIWIYLERVWKIHFI